ARASSRRRRKSPRRNSAAAARGAGCSPTATAPSPLFLAERTQTKRASRAARRRRQNGWRGGRSLGHLAARRGGEHNTRIAGKPERHRDLAVRAGRQRLLAQHIEAGGFEPLRDGFGGKAETAMGMLLAQKFE